MKSDIEKQVMASVGVIYTARTLASRTALECYALALSALGIVRFVSVPHVLANMRGAGFSGFFNFMLVAVTKTQTIVQAALFIGAVALVMLVADLIRSHGASRRLAY